MIDVMARQYVSQVRHWRATHPVGRVLVVALSAVVIFSAAADAKRYPSGTGILSAQTGGGLITIAEPKQSPWVGSFGSYFLCTTSGREVAVQRIRYETPVRPLDVNLKLREVNENTSGIISSQGSPPKFIDPDNGSSLRMEGSYKSFQPGLRITRPCSESGKGDHGFTELLFVVKVDHRGGVINRAWIDYTVEGNPKHRYSLALKWVMVLCGDRVRGYTIGTPA
ncbi:hypothetical protein O7599_06265 [Streptomyces sp. WMMC500]|uniref:hypothetical protein n=1 Tax=Streptomyces sp. WMMC500 TaxID=3015154 RepID=UPI00248AABD7|nr:hypothetical protein [Streptomyces sp. WMMC500]WBB62136.1 hypothetical protein O7599_06265 [Streptomyces sp. WMMC500]